MVTPDQSAVGLESRVVGLDVVLGEMGLAGHVEVDLHDLGHDEALGVGHRLGDELHVEVVADGRDRTRLVVTEQVAGAADLEVAHGDLEAAAERRVVADRAKPLVGRLGEDLVGRVEEVGVGALAAAPDATAQLVQLTRGPRRSARSTIKVFTVGRSMPDSTIVVHTSTSNRPCQKSTITRSRVPSSI